MKYSKHIFTVALCTHVLAVAVTTLVGLNPDASGDVDTFARTARRFAATTKQGTLPSVSFTDTDEVWGSFLSPFWLLPGPSRVYARFVNAILGVAATCNVYSIATTYHSERAGAFAALPLIFYPSFLSTHSTILREAIILCGLTIVANVYLHQRFGSAMRRHFVVVALMVPVVIQRSDNLPVYVLVFAVAAAVSWIDFSEVRTGVYALAAALLVTAWLHPITEAIVDDLAEFRRARATGRTAYIADVFPATVPSAVAFSWIGAMYFLYAPFPWMVEIPFALPIAIEGVVNVLYTVAAVSGTRYLWRQAPAATAGLVVGIVVGSVLYGLGTANVGTAVRHRQMILWAIFLLGGIGVADRMKFRVSG